MLRRLAFSRNSQEKPHNTLDSGKTLEQCALDPGNPPPRSERSPLVPRFLHQVSYTSEALARLITNPQDRFEAVRAPIEKLGGKIEHGYFAFGEHDAILITEMPDTVSAAAIALAFAAGGALRNCSTTALMTNAEALDAMRKAATCGYKAIGAGAAAAR